MKVRFLRSAQPGLRWMRRYYTLNPQFNKAKAFVSLNETKRRIQDTPPPSKTFGNLDGIWEVSILGTAFSLIYAIERSHILIIDVRDQRGNRSWPAVEEFLKQHEQLH